MSSDSEFVPPASLAAAEEQRIVVMDEIQKLSLQLADKSHRDVTRDQYTAWRKSLLEQKYAKETLQRRLKLWIKTENARLERGPTTEYDPKDPVSLLAASYRLFNRLLQESIEFEPKEWGIVEAIRDYLKEKGLPPSLASSKVVKNAKS